MGSDLGGAVCLGLYSTLQKQMAHQLEHNGIFSGGIVLEWTWLTGTGMGIVHAHYQSSTSLQSIVLAELMNRPDQTSIFACCLLDSRASTLGN